MKKFIILLLVLCVTICFASCKNNENNYTDNNINTASGIDNNTYDTDTTVHIHSYSDATCTQPPTCSCGVTIGEALGHEISEATCLTPGMCTRCNTKFSEPLGHNWKEATCESPKICLRCDLTKGIASGHNYSSNHICTVCGQQDALYAPVKLSSLESYMTSQEYHGSFKTCDSKTDIWGTEHRDIIYVSGGFSSTTSNGMETYRLNQKYERITGKVFLSDYYKNTQYTGSVVIYGDGKVIYEIRNIGAGFETVSFDIDISNVKDLSIYINDPDFYGAAQGRCLSEVTLYPQQ